jgi:DNA-binding MurR/RpiR family transcriptional regulator
MSIGALAEACGSSAPTVYRFCRDLGYGGYKEFQLDLVAAVAQSDGKALLDDFGEGASPKTIIDQVFEFNRQSLSDTERMLDNRTVVAVTSLIQRSRRVLFIGTGSSALVARRAADLLLSLGYTAIALIDPYTQIFATENVGRSDVVMGISHTGQTINVIEAIQTARRRGARTVALTNYPQSPLATVSTFRLITAFREHRINAAVSSSIIAQLGVISAIYFILGSRSGRRAKRLADAAELRTQKILRVPRTKKQKLAL